MRRGPVDGYDFGRKRDYRRKIWATFRDWMKRHGACLAESHVALMPSSEADEIEVALDAGFREWNLHIIDDNPAIVASVKRRYRRVNTYGVSASSALRRMLSEGVRISCANFDFCGQMSQKYLNELSDISRTGSFGAATTFSRHNYGVFSDHSLIAVNMLRGRESSRGTILREDSMNEASMLEASGSMASHPAYTEVIARTLVPYSRMEVRDRQRLFVVNSALSLSHLIEPELSDRMARHLTTGGLVPWFPLPVAKLIRAETYVSVNGQSMLWSVWYVESVRSLNEYLTRSREGEACAVH